MLAVEENEVVLLPVILKSAGTFFRCLDRATKGTVIPNAKKIYTVHSIHSLQNLVSERRFVKRNPPSSIFMRDF
jgi:hypothetical protein